MKKLISVILAGVMMAGLCACGKGTSAKETQENAKETTKETVESETEDSSGGQTESSNPHLLVLEGLSDQELFDFCHETRVIRKLEKQASGYQIRCNTLFRVV